jgi:hypothetical protein
MVMDDRGDSAESGTRAPVTFAESIVANLRPQPAIPALLVLLLTTMLAVFSYDPAGSRSLLILLAPAGILASCGLAIAAGFCSLFPQAAWILVAAWALKFTTSGPLPPYNRFVIFAGMFACAVMMFVQVWRVRTGRFSPTIRLEDADQD